LVMIAAAVLAGCGGGGGGSSVNTVTTPIGGAGGIAQDSSKKATVTIPAGALALTTNITVGSGGSGVPASAQLVPGTAFSFGPSGTTFATPATLSVAYDPTQVPAGATQSTLSLFTPTPDGKDWQQVTGCSVDTTAHTVSGQISHFSIYAVLAVNQFATTNLTGSYVGTSGISAGDQGAFLMAISPSGTLTITNTPSEDERFSGTGTVSLLGNATLSTVIGSGVDATGETFAFTGTFHSNGGTLTASGTYTNQQAGQTGSGTWSIP